MKQLISGCKLLLKKYSIMLLSISILFAACDSSKNKNKTANTSISPGDEYAQLINSVDDLPACGVSSEGNLFYVISDGEFYYCDGSEYQYIDLTGPAGENGIPIVWKGALSEAPINPEINWAYYNIEDNTSYIWDGDSWDIMVSSSTRILPYVVYTNPSNNDKRVAWDSDITLVFNKEIALDTVNSTNIVVKHASGSTVSGTYACNGNVVTFNPSEDFERFQTYTVTISQGLTDTAGTAIAYAYSFNFTCSGSNIVPIIISGDKCESASNPEMAADSSGNFIAVWLSVDNEAYYIRANRYIAGTGWSGVVTLDTLIAGYKPKIVVNASGDAIVWWGNERDGYKAAIYTPASGWGGSEGIALPSSSNFRINCVPDIVINSSGIAFVVWSEKEIWTYGDTFNIWAASYIPGSGWNDAELIESFIDSEEYSNVIDLNTIIDSSGNLTVVWNCGVENTEEPYDTIYNIYTNRYIAGSGWAGTDILFTYTEDILSINEEEIPLAVDSSGNVMAMWRDNNSSADVYAARLTPAGGWGEQEVIGEDNSLEDYKLVMNNAGEAIAIWNGVDLYTARFTPADGWTVAEVIESDSILHANVAMNNAGNAISVWRSGYTDITAANFSATGGWGESETIASTVDLQDLQVNMTDSGSAAVLIQNTHLYLTLYNDSGIWETTYVIDSEQATPYYPSLVTSNSGDSMVIWVQSNGYQDVVYTYLVE